MTSTITALNGAGATTPLWIAGYEAERQSRNLVHDLVGGGVVVTLLKPRPRSGTLNLHYATDADAFAALQLHQEVSLFLLADDESPLIGMTYMLDANGRMTIELDTDSDLWALAVPFFEVDA